MATSGPWWGWKPVVQHDLFARAYHTCNVVQDKLFVFGGVKSGGPNKIPLDEVATFDPEQQSVEKVSENSRHGRSHHDTVVLGGRWLCVVGGWDGSKRVSSVFSFDTESKVWDTWAEGPSNDPPVGLSSHTCTKVSDHELRIVGREGGLRTQRRYASVYTLRVNANTKTYWYKEEASRTASRSGHSAMLVHNKGLNDKDAGYKLLVFGGRESTEVDVAGHWGREKMHIDTIHAPKLIEQLSRLMASARACRQIPKGLRHHSCTMVGPFAVIYGGETLSKGRDTICNDLYIYDTRCSPPAWFHFPRTDRHQKRVGHRTCLFNDTIYLIGGFGADGKTPCPEICTLEIGLKE
ncbi:kelch domain-containing protein 9 [Ambystoma mexicanum]|uniref:kelch domain-containing protein 9 n=1 Tax=Ambystoma mexicanum TaxID=8296 RepID=UPI0037E880DA